MTETERQKLTRYLQGLKYSIQDELALFNPNSVHACFQMALRIEEKLKRKSDSQNKNKGGRSSRGRESFEGRGSFKRNEESSGKESHEGESSNRGSFRGRRGNGRGRLGGRTPGLFTGRYFNFRWQHD